MSQTYTLKRDGDRSLVFDGVLLGEGSSRRGSAARWFEVAIYKTDGGTYIVSGVGRTVNDGETDRCWVEVCDTPQGAVDALKREDDDGVEYLTRTARDALEAAARADDGLRDAFLKRVA